MNSVCTLLSCGSFNPITVMHVRLLNLAKHHLETKRNVKGGIRGVISPANDKYAIHKHSLSPAHHRLAMIMLALKDHENNWILCDDWETKQQEWVRTLPALKHYESVYGSNLKLVCGADLFESFLVPGLWSDDHIEEILARYGLVVIPRNGSNPWKLLHDSPKSHIFRKHLDQIDILDESVSLDISSTMLTSESQAFIDTKYESSLDDSRQVEELPDTTSYLQFTKDAQIEFLNLESLRHMLFGEAKAYERLCKLQNNTYVVCHDFCCGEFWETSDQFCCTNNFRPIRNLFAFLLIVVTFLFVIVLVYIGIELLVKKYVVTKVKQLQELGNQMSNVSWNKELVSSDDTTLDGDDSSLDDHISFGVFARSNKHLLNKHSQSFKDMSLKNSLKRMPRAPLQKSSRKLDEIVIKNM